MNSANINSTNFPASLKSSMEKIAQSHKKKDFLHFHQLLVSKYLINNSFARGILLYHEMGMGKSITSVSIAEHYRETDPTRKIIILLAKSLQANYKKNIAKYIQHNQKLSKSQIDSVIEDKYKFISLNASNMFSQVRRINKTKEEIAFEKQLKEFTNVIEKDDFLENSLLIIDEYHNLSNSITNGSYNAISLYDAILKTKNIKLLFMTGTPVVNDPFELAPTFNMLKGYIPIGKYGNEKISLFPELKKDFYKFFVDSAKNKIKNKNRFENRIMGMVSYYGNMYLGKKQQEGFPEEFKTKVEKIHMSDEQFVVYDAARDAEREEESYKARKVSAAERFASRSSVSSSYRVKSRQISNFVIPDYALTHRGKKIIKHIGKISDSYIKNLDVASPKFKRILANIKKHKNELGLFYSEFVSGEGIALFAKVLKSNGYVSWNEKNKHSDASDAFDMKISEKSTGGGLDTYAIISGDVDFVTRSKIVKEFNDANNTTGKKISILLISKTGAEGLDLKNIRHIHICEPYWNMARIDQIIARGVRYLSHTALPLKQRNVQPYVYLSDYPKSYAKKKKKELTTDIELYTNAEKTKYLIDQFYIALIEASIDCTTHEKKFVKSVKNKIKCRMCSPDNKPLYNNILSKDLSIPDPCKKLQKGEIKAKELDINGVKYYYTNVDGDFHIFKYDEAINGYTPLQAHEEPYSDIMKYLLDV